MGSLLRVKGLTTRFLTENGQVNAVHDVSFNIKETEVFGMVGESGSGKSVTALSLLNLVGSQGRICDGEIWYKNSDIAKKHPGVADGQFVDMLALPDSVRGSLRGTHLNMIFQDPNAAMNPTVTVGKQIAETVEVKRRARRNIHTAQSAKEKYGLGSLFLDTIIPNRSFVSNESWDRAIELLGEVGISDPGERAEEYPHQYSGGMLQRAMIAQAIAGDPNLLVADEPTTALDVTIQAQIIDLLQDLQAEKDMSVLLITHDLGVIARMSDRVGVMYAGEIVERGSISDVFDAPIHPYTKGMLESIPDPDEPDLRLNPMPGNVPSLIDEEMEDRCYFANRCPKAMKKCLHKPPEFTSEGDQEYDLNSSKHTAKCYLAEQNYEPKQAIPEEFFEMNDNTMDESDISNNSKNQNEGSETPNGEDKL